jgi:KaiC/GvpD/RAD55 family RecA-like ATPase
MTCPKEITNTLDRKSGYITIVKGSPGAGKTTFALELLKRYKDTGIYFSTRTSVNMLYDQFPWLIDVIDRDKFFEKIPGEISSILEDSVRFEYTNKIEFIKELYDLVNLIEGTPFIVLDSWEGIIGQIGERETSALDMELLNVFKGIRANTVLVLERSIQTPLDYLVDGVIEIKDDEINGRKIREMYINKMRGVRINQFKYLITLNKGEFNYFEEFVEDYNSIVQLYPEDGETKSYTSNVSFFKGSSSGLTDIITEYKKRSHIFFEIDEEVDPMDYSLLILKIINDYIAKKGNIIMIEQKDDLIMLDEQKYPVEAIRLSELAEKDADSTVLIDRLKKIVKAKKEPVLLINYYDGIERILGKDSEKWINLYLGDLSEYLIIDISSKDNPLRDRLANIASVHLKIKERNGCTIIYGVIPKSGIYVINKRRSEIDNTIDFDLVPIL